MNAPLALLLILLALPAVAQDAPILRPVLSEVVTPLETQALRFVGTVEPQISADIGFQVLGRLVSRNVDVGDSVTAGQVLATLDTLALDQSVRAATAALASAQAELANALGTEDRQRRLRETGNATAAIVESAEQAREAARSGVERAEADLDKAREQLGYATLTAGFDGVVTASVTEVGQVVSAGQVVMTLARPDLREAVVDLPDWMTDGLTIGTPFTVALELDPTVTTPGTVRDVAPVADSTTRSRRVHITLENAPPGFRLGSTVTAGILGDEGSTITIPPSALRRKDGKTQVWIVDGAAVRLRDVVVDDAARTDGRIAVQAGLAAGETVVTAGVNSLTDGQAIRVEGSTE